MLSKKPEFYLASKSPRRKSLLLQLGCNFKVLPVDIDEKVLDDIIPCDYVSRVSREKAECGWKLLTGQQLSYLPVLAADTSVVIDGEILGKPRGKHEAITMLRMLGGKTHQVITSVHMKNHDRIYERISVTEVEFMPVSLSMAEYYWNTKEPVDKAGGYAIQGYGSVFVKKITGSYSGVVGLPLHETAMLFEKFGIPFWNNSFIFNSKKY